MGAGRGGWLLRFVLAGFALVALGVLVRRLPAYSQYSLRLLLAGAGVLLLRFVLAGRGGVGKTGELGCRILDAPGAVIATSTRTDLLETTGPVRGRRGPVWVFNPSGLGGLEPTIVFDPLAGCEQPKAAAARAADLLAGTD